MAVGKHLPKQGGWLVSGALALLIGGAAFAGSVLMSEGTPAKAWIVAWIWPRDEMGAIRIGILQDSMGLVMTSVSAMVSSVLMLDAGLLTKNTRGERLYAALTFSTCGVTLAWVSLTPWIAFFGIALAVVGGVVAFGSRWDVDYEAEVAIRFAYERFGGLLLIVIGTCILVASGASMEWLADNGSSATAGGANFGKQLGAFLLVTGLFVQLQPFPLLGWLICKSEVPSFLRVLLTQVFPAWAAFAVLVRLHPQLTELGVFPDFGWYALASSLLALFCAFFQTDSRRALVLWLSAGFSTSTAILAFTGPWGAMASLLGVSLGGSAFCGWSAAFDNEGNATASNRKRASWSKAGTVLSVCAATGFIGFVSASAGFQWVAGSWDRPEILVSFVATILLSTVLGWKLAFDMILGKVAIEVPWISVLSPFVLVFLALGFFWTGTASGHVIPGNPDEIFPSVLNLFFGAQAGKITNESAAISSSVVYWSTWIFGFGIGLWLAKARNEPMLAAYRALPKFSKFVATGYGIEDRVSQLYRWTRILGSSLEWLIDKKLWNEWVPNALAQGITWGSTGWLVFEARVSDRGRVILARFINVPAKMLQLIQSGDVQWYIFFAMSSLLVMMVHFYRA